MSEAIKAGEVFKLAELVPYVEGKIVNMDVVHNDKMKFVVMAFDEGTGLSEHAAPGEALTCSVWALSEPSCVAGMWEGMACPLSSQQDSLRTEHMSCVSPGQGGGTLRAMMDPTS